MKKFIIFLIYFYIFISTTKNFGDNNIFETKKQIINFAKQHIKELNNLKLSTDLLLAEALALQLGKEFNESRTNQFNQKIILSSSRLRKLIDQISNNFKSQTTNLLNNL